MIVIMVNIIIIMMMVSNVLIRQNISLHSILVTDCYFYLLGKEAMFSVASVCLFVCLLAALLIKVMKGKEILWRGPSSSIRNMVKFLVAILIFNE